MRLRKMPKLSKFDGKKGVYPNGDKGDILIYSYDGARNDIKVTEVKADGTVKATTYFESARVLTFEEVYAISCSKGVTYNLGLLEVFTTLGIPLRLSAEELERISKYRAQELIWEAEDEEYYEKGETDGEELYNLSDME